jgi:hypothetical protein
MAEDQRELLDEQLKIGDEVMILFTQSEGTSG